MNTGELLGSITGKRRSGRRRTDEERSSRDRKRRLQDHDSGSSVSRAHRTDERSLTRRRRGDERERALAVQGGSTMRTWSKDELRRIAEADDLHISPFREDGVTYGTPTWIWSVAASAGMTKEVTFEPVDGPINDLI